MLIVALICELDEQWSYVGSKARQHWLWYAYNTKTGAVVLAYTLVPEPIFKRAGSYWHCLPTPFNIGMLTSDDWGSYGREVPKNSNLTGPKYSPNALSVII